MIKQQSTNKTTLRLIARIVLSAALLNINVYANADAVSVRGTHNRDAGNAIRLQERKGIWWFISAENQPFISTGINHVEPQLILGPHNIRHSYQKYGMDLTHWNRVFNPEGAAAHRWITEVKANFDRWGINTFAYHTSAPLSMVKDSHYFVARIRSASIESYTPVKHYVDVFTDEFVQQVDAGAKRITELFGSEPNLLGYAYTDIPPWFIRRDNTNPWVTALREQEANTPGKWEWIKVLQKHYASPAEVDKVYPLAAFTWDALAEHKHWKPLDLERGRHDIEALVLRIVERWYKVHHDAIRRYDAHHLILGDKVTRGVLDEAWPIIAQYVDLINIQWYATFAEQKKLLAHIYELTGKPILMGDSSFSIVKPYQDNAKGVKVASQDAVGDAYYKYMRNIMRIPYIVGWHFCGYMEGQRGMQSPDTHEDKQNGFLDPFGKPFEYTLKRVTEANMTANKWHAAAR